MQRSTIAPEWFQAKAVEVKGEGYPALAEIPVQRGTSSDQPEWEAAAASLRAAAAKFEVDLDAAGAIPTEEEIRARAAQMRAKVEGDEAAKDGVQP
jgi:hypothetical protein